MENVMHGKLIISIRYEIKLEKFLAFRMHLTIQSTFQMYNRYILINQIFRVINAVMECCHNSTTEIRFGRLLCCIRVLTLLISVECEPLISEVIFQLFGLFNRYYFAKDAFVKAWPCDSGSGSILPEFPLRSQFSPWVIMWACWFAYWYIRFNTSI